MSYLGNAPVTGGEPVGRIAILLGPNPEPGWFVIGEGGTYDTTAFPMLAIFMQANFPELAPGVFPDWQGYSPRTIGGLGPALRAKQEDALKWHKHTSTVSLNGSTENGPVATGYGNFAVGLPNGSSATTRDNVSGPKEANNSDAATATETRVKSFGVRWQIKAFGTLVNTGAVDMVIISNIANSAVRRDIDQNAQGFSSAYKINLLKNTLQAFEIVGTPVISAANQLRVFYDNLADYERLIIGGNLLPVNSGVGMTMQISSDNGSSWRSLASSFGFVGSVSASSGVAITTNSSYNGNGLYLNDAYDIGNVYPIDFKLEINQWNKTRRKNYHIRSTWLNSAGNTEVTREGGGRVEHSVVLNAFQITTGLGNLAINDFYVLGLRG